MKGKFIKRFTYWIISMVIVIFSIEMSPYLVSPVLLGHPFSRDQISASLMKQTKEDGQINAGSEFETQENGYLGDHILHPYLGFVSVPGNTENRFNFPGPDPVIPQSPAAVNVCLTGGSVAMGLYSNASAHLIEKLQQNSFFKGKKINLAVVALGGFKQPQQLLALNYFLSLGAHFDVVINLDGFNEIVLPYSDNLPFGVFASYPRHWNIYSRKRLDSKVQLILNKQSSIQDEMQQLNRFFVKTHLYQSNFGLLLWEVLNNKKRSALFATENQLRLAMQQSESDYQATGPAEPVIDTIQFFKEQADLWMRSSILMDGLGKTWGFDYFHFLQPNQYVEGSKQLTKEELTIAYEHNAFDYKTAVHRGYPLLIENGKLLKESDVHFLDLTWMFENEKRTVYNDKCCHFNQMGYNMIADEIAGYIGQYFDSQADKP